MGGRTRDATARAVHFSPDVRIALCALLVSLAGVAVVGCAQKRTPPLARAVTPPVATAAVPAPPREDEGVADRVKRPRLGEAAVYLDGKPAGVLRRLELPATLSGKVLHLAGGYETTRYPFTDYARSLGIDAKRVRAVHLYGGSRVSVVDAAEWRRIGDRLMFSFVQGDRGKPRVHYPGMKLNVNTTIDMLSGVAFYVDKEPPVLKDGELVMPDGARVAEKVPYAPEEQGNGTRVYVDGALVGTVKRKKLTNDLLVPGDEDARRFSLLAYATKLRPEAAKAKSIDLVAGDDVVARLPDAAKKVTFQVPAHNRGQAVVDVPTDDGSRAARISAVQIWVQSAPPSRTVVKIDEAPEAAPADDGRANASDDEL
jgi:hypothetical protein